MLQKLPACKVPSHRPQFLSTRNKLQLLLGLSSRNQKSQDHQKTAGHVALPSWPTPTLKTASITCSACPQTDGEFCSWVGIQSLPPPPPITWEVGT